MLWVCKLFTIYYYYHIFPTFRSSLDFSNDVIIFYFTTEFVYFVVARQDYAMTVLFVICCGGACAVANTD